MWDVVVTLAGEAVIALAGPVAISAVRRRKSIAADVRTARSQASGTSPIDDDVSTDLTRALADADIAQTHAIRVQRFVRSASGSYLMRIVAINVIADEQELESLEPSLAKHAAALMGLEWREIAEWHQPAAKVLTHFFVEAVSSVYSGIERKNRATSRDLREVARDQLNLPYRLKVRNVDERVKAIEELIPRMPADVIDSVTAYCAALAQATEKLTVSTLPRDFEVDLAGMRVVPTMSTMRDVDSRLLSVPDPLAELRDTEHSANQVEVDDPLLRTLALYSRLVVLGDPGAGKSTAVIAGVHRLALDAIDGDHSAIPFRLTLRHYAEEIRSRRNTPIVEFLAKSIGADLDVDLNISIIRYLFQTGSAVMFFDGLDEILDFQERQTIIQRIHRLTSNYPGLAVVVTSRAVGYDQQPLSSTFHTITVEPFDAHQASAFCRGIFAHLASSETETAALTKTFMDQSIGIDDLRSNPLMLGVLCSLYALNRTIPSNRLELYTRCADMLFIEWDRRKNTVVRVADEELTELATRHLALKVFESGQEEFSEQWLRNCLVELHGTVVGSNPISAGRFADDALRLWRGRRWLIVFLGDRGGEDYYRFSHRTFLEFFAAEQVVYLNRGGAGLWSRLRPLVERRSAETFCLLAVEFGFRRSVFESDDFFNAALDSVGDGALSTELVNEQSDGVFSEEWLFAVNALAFCMRCLAFSRATPNVSLRVTSTFVQHFCALIPWLSVAERRLTVGSSNLSFSDIRIASSADPQLQGWTATEDEDDPDLTIETLSTPFLYLEDLRDIERDRHVEEIFAESQRILEKFPILGIRLGMTMLQVVHFESWREVAVRADFHQRAGAFWRHICEMPLVDGAMFSIPDYWAALALARDGASLDGSVLSLLELRDMFVGDWPLPVVQFPTGCIAHTLIAATLTKEPRASIESTLAYFRNLVLENPTFVRGGLQTISFIDFANGNPSRLPRTGESRDAHGYAENDWLFLLFLLAGISSLQDGAFYDECLSIAFTSDWHPIIRLVVECCQYPALLDLENPLDHHQLRGAAISEESRLAIEGALKRIVGDN